jgi:S1-C subfamily serine protease
MPGQAPDIFILFDAVVQPGNSGGPLLNDRGQVIGVVVAGTMQPGASGGLAVSSAALKASLPALLEGARLERPWIGIAGVTIDADLLRSRRLGASRGVLIVEVVPDSPAARAGLRGDSAGGQGDVIVSVDGQPIEDWEDLLLALGVHQPGERMRLGIVRDPTYFEVQLTLDARP